MFDDKILRPILIYKYHLNKFVQEVDFEQVLEEHEEQAVKDSESIF